MIDLESDTQWFLAIFCAVMLAIFVGVYAYSEGSIASQPIPLIQVLFAYPNTQPNMTAINKQFIYMPSTVPPSINGFSPEVLSSNHNVSWTFWVYNPKNYAQSVVISWYLSYPQLNSTIRQYVLFSGPNNQTIGADDLIPFRLSWSLAKNATSNILDQFNYAQSGGIALLRVNIISKIIIS